MLAAFGGGALLGTIAAGQVGRLRRPVIAGSLAFLAEAACIAVAPYLGATFAVAAAMAGTGVLNGFGVFPISVALAALLVRRWGPSPFFLLAAASTAVAILAGLSQRAWREFGSHRPTTTPEPAHHLEGQPV
jgi:hypothetical protein